MQERNDNEILFSKMVKAGKRIYYIDVKQDRKGGYYLSMTESKRLKGNDEGQPPLFEKHKIFLYREDIEKFRAALDEAAAYVESRQEQTPGEAPGGSDLPGSGDFHFDIEF